MLGVQGVSKALTARPVPCCSVTIKLPWCGCLLFGCFAAVPRRSCSGVACGTCLLWVMCRST